MPEDAHASRADGEAGFAGGGIVGRIAYALYDLLGLAAGVFTLPLLPLLAASRTGKGLGERLGLLPPEARKLDRPLWVHAASVGEVLAAEPLVRELRRRLPGVPVLASTTSLTGRSTARERLGADAVMLLPIDLAWIVGRVLRRIRPRGIVIVETELWPALLRATARQGTPCLIASGRISRRSAARYRWIRPLLRAALAQPAAFLMQTAADADRIIELGAPASRVRVTGSLKYARDAGRSGTGRTPSAEDRGLGGRPLLVAASTHPGEEELALHAARIVRARHPDVMLLVAPRRPERFDEVAALLEREGERFVRRSAPGGPVLRTADTLLLDSVGELLDWMPLAEAVFVGGTVAPGVGGHNVLEPALFGKPVAFGPATGNVEGAAEALLAAGAGRRIHGTEELAHEWGRLLDSAPERARMGEAGRAVVRTQAGVAAATCAGILQVLAERGSGGGCQPQP